MPWLLRVMCVADLADIFASHFFPETRIFFGRFSIFENAKYFKFFSIFALSDFSIPCHDSNLYVRVRASAAEAVAVRISAAARRRKETRR